MIYTEFSLIHAQIILRLEASIVWIFNKFFDVNDVINKLAKPYSIPKLTLPREHSKTSIWP